MSSYAQGTDVSTARSINELDRLVSKHGATGFGYGRDAGRVRIMFRIADRMVRFEIEQPSIDEFRWTPTRQRRTDATAARMAEDEERRRWRSLVLVVKALLVAVADGVITLSDAFLPYTVLPSGQTVGEWAGPQLDTAYATATMPALMPGAAPSRLAIESAAEQPGGQKP